MSSVERKIAPQPGTVGIAPRPLLLAAGMIAAVGCAEPAATPPLSEAELWVTTPRVVRGLQQGLAAQDWIMDELLRLEGAGWIGIASPLDWPGLFVDTSGRMLCDRGTASLIFDERADGDTWVRKVSLRAEGCEQVVDEEWPSDAWDETSPIMRDRRTARIDGTYTATANWPTDEPDGQPSALTIEGDFTQEFSRTESVDGDVLESHTDRVTVAGLRVGTSGEWPNVAVAWDGEVIFEMLDKATELRRVEWRFDDWTRVYHGDDDGHRPTHVSIRGRFGAAGGPDGDHGCLANDLDARTAVPFDAQALIDRHYCFREGELDAGELDMTFTDGGKVIGHSGGRAVDLDCRSVRASWIEACFSPIW